MSVEEDSLLAELVKAILAGNRDAVSAAIAEAPQLAKAAFRAGATRQNAREYFITSLGSYINAGDTALHIAAAAHRAEITSDLLKAGANVHAKNRYGATPLHAASAGQPASLRWNPEAQAATIAYLLKAGADVNGTDRRGVAPLHIAARTRCAAAVRTLLEGGADPMKPNGSGSLPMKLATLTTGRGGSATVWAKVQQKEILAMLRERGAVLR